MMKTSLWWCDSFHAFVSSRRQLLPWKQCSVATAWVGLGLGLGVEVVGYGRKERPYLLLTDTTGPVRRGVVLITFSTSKEPSVGVSADQQYEQHKCNNCGFHANVLIHPSSLQPSFPTSRFNPAWIIILK